MAVFIYLSHIYICYYCFMSENKKPVIIALTGKGGVGKTTISAIIVKLLCELGRDKKILAIDADPAVGLSTALCVEPKLSLDDIRSEAVDVANTGDISGAIDTIGQARYRIYDAIVECRDFCFLSIGRPESAGCYCKINTYLKSVIEDVASNFDYVIIDGEAGIEQINRRVMDKVSHLIMVSDTSKKGLDVVSTIYNVANKLVMFDHAGVIINRVTDNNLLKHIKLDNLKVLSTIEADNNITKFDLSGKSILDLNDMNKSVIGVKKALVNLGIL